MRGTATAMTATPTKVAPASAPMGRPKGSFGDQPRRIGFSSRK